MIHILAVRKNGGTPASIGDGSATILYDDDLMYEFFDDHILVTNLFNYTLPLVRYRTEDTLQLTAEHSGTDPYLHIDSVIARNGMNPVFVNRNGVEDFISWYAFRDIYRDNYRAGVLRVQMQWLSSVSFRFVVCLDPQLEASRQEAVLAALENRLHELLDQKAMDNVSFTVASVSEIPPDPKTRKFQIVVDARSNQTAPGKH